MRQWRLGSRAQIFSMSGLDADVGITPVRGPWQSADPQVQAEFGPYANAGYADGYGDRPRKIGSYFKGDARYADVYGDSYQRGVLDRTQPLSSGKPGSYTTSTPALPITARAWAFVVKNPVAVAAGLALAFVIFKRKPRRSLAGLRSRRN